MSWFIKNIDLLDENSRLDDLLNLNSKKNEFLDRFSHLEKSSLIWITAPFGSGKTTFLNQVKIDLEGRSHWMNFDAWKYPDRKDLRENFVLEFARSIDIKTFDESLSKIEWTQNDDKKTLLNVFWDMPLLGVIKNFSHFLKTTPAKKTFELQEIMVFLLEKIEDEEIYIIIEDIDRSWDAGIFFLETLNYFIKSNPSSKKIIVLVSIWSEQRTLNLNSYLKCLDYSREFDLEWVECGKMVENLFEGSLFIGKTYKKWQMQTFFEWYFKEFSSQATMRLLKKCLREANLNYIQLKAKYSEVVDYRLCIMVEVAKNTITGNTEFKDEKISYYNLWKRQQAISGNSSIFAALIWCLTREKETPLDSIYEDNYDSRSWTTIKKLMTVDRIPIKIESYTYPDSTKVKDSILYRTDDFHPEKNHYMISDIYFF